MLYSPSTRGFYLPELHGSAVPADAVPVSADRHAELMQQQADGQVIVPAPGTGAPTAVEPGPAAAAPRRRLSPLAFRRRLDGPTRAAITLAASRALEAGDATLQTWLDDLSAAGVVDLDHPEVVAGVDALLAQGLITAEQRDALLADAAAGEV